MPELQEVVRPHPHFMLFATQNPPGIYAGRKTLSRCVGGRETVPLVSCLHLPWHLPLSSLRLLPVQLPLVQLLMWSCCL